MSNFNRSEESHRKIRSQKIESLRETSISTWWESNYTTSSVSEIGVTYGSDHDIAPVPLELVDHDGFLSRIREMPRCNTDNIEAFRLNVQAEMRNVVQSMPTEPQRKAYGCAQQAFNYILFSAPGEPLPEIYKHTPEHGLRMDELTLMSMGTTVGAVDMAMQSFRSNLAVHSAIINLFDVDRKHFSDASLQYFLSSPMYQKLSAILNGPEQDYDDKPLTLTEKLMYGAAALDDTMKRHQPDPYGVDDDTLVNPSDSPRADVATDPGASREYNRALLAIDDYTLRQPDDQPSSPLSRLIGYACDTLSRQIPDKVIRSVSVGARIKFQQSDDARGVGGFYNISSDDVVRTLLDDLGDASDVTRLFCQELLTNTFKKDNRWLRDRSRFNNALETAGEKVNEKYLGDPSDPPGLARTSRLALLVQLLNDVPATEPGGDQQSIGDRQYVYNALGMLDGVTYDEDQFAQIDKEALINKEAKRFADVEILDGGVGDDRQRILTVELDGYNYPIISADQADAYGSVCKVKLDSVNSSDIHLMTYAGYSPKPFIAGLEIIGTDGVQGYYFAPIDGDDPYRTCEVPIKSDYLSSITGRLRLRGVDGLADALESSETVADVMESLSRELVYDLPIGYSQGTFDFNDYLDEHVYNGRLEAQCTSAYGIAREILGVMFSIDDISPQSGHMVDMRTGVCTALGHRQLLFRHGDQSYILDPTPSTELDRDPPDWVQEKIGQSYSRLRGARMKNRLKLRTNIRRKKRAKKSPANRPVKSRATEGSNSPKYEGATAPTESKVSEPSLIQIFKDAHNELIKTLRLSYGIESNQPDGDLYKRLQSLPEADPVRRAVRLDLQLTGPDYSRADAYEEDVNNSDVTGMHPLEASEETASGQRRRQEIITEAESLGNYAASILRTIKENNNTALRSQYSPSLINQIGQYAAKIESALT